MRSALLFLCVACSTTAARPTSAASDYPDPPMLEITGPDFVRRQKVVAVYGGKQASVDAVLQKRGAEVLLVGLTPYGSKAFELTRTADGLRFKREVPVELPFPPKYIFDDVARTYWSGIPGAPLADGDHLAQVGDEHITERWSGGKLLERTFTRPDRPGELRISYGEGMAGHRSPPVILFLNGWLGYQLTITTASEQAL